jgi:aarF domain-containing kinase
MAQWASSRPDLFGEDFCNVFCRLQDKTNPHSWEETVQILVKDFGPDWEDKLQLDLEPIGSGSVAQVYRGRVTMPGGPQWEQIVAVKVLHPGVADTIEVDFDLLESAARGLCKLPFGMGERMVWLNAVGMVQEFGELLEGQLDLREEAANLVRFNENFKTHQYGVRFPKSIAGFTDSPTKNVLIEEFIEGVPVMQWADTHGDHTLRESMSRRGIQAVCKMIFQDNFLHGDLHPGNVLITNNNEIVMLDVGITKVFAKRDHDLLVKVLTCFIRSNGRAAAVHMVENSDFRVGLQSKPEDVQMFADKIEAMVMRAKTDESFFGSLGSYFTAICDAASSHRVKMNQGFVTMALAVKVMEGIALELDPKIEVWAIANPMILEGTAVRKWSEIVNELVNFWLPDVAHTKWSYVRGLLPMSSPT